MTRRGPSGWQMLNNPFAALVYILILAVVVVYAALFALAVAGLALAVWLGRLVWAKARSKQHERTAR